MARHSGRSRVSVLDGLAQLELARGKHRECQQYLDEITALRPDDLAYARLWSRLTQARLWLAQGRSSDSARLASSALDSARSVKSRQLSSFLLLLRAEANAFLGEPTEAADDVVAALEGHAEPPLELLGEVQRVLGRALARQGDRVGAAEAFDRSVRILGSIGHLRAAKEAARQAADDGIVIVAPDGRGTRVPAALPDHRPGLLVQRTAAIVEEATRPDLLATECMGVLAATGALRAAAVVSRDATGGRRVEFLHEWDAAHVDAALEDPAMLTAPLGTWRERDWTLVADVPPGLDARTTWTAVRALATSGAALAAARRDAREREALWPIENPDLPTHGVFLCEQMQELHRTARKVASTDMLVLLTGETGVGKEVFARIIHDASPRAAKPFVPFNCSAVPREMLESQLFGHRRGAFTGADHDAPGVIRAAAGGTLFLDEIGDVAPELQPKLLRFLELGEIQPLGEPQPSKVDVRVVAATNRQLDELVREGRFREDLYFRLTVIPLPIPPLRERREEIPGLTEYFLRRFARESHKGHLRVANETMEYLLLYAWPGNVRQLMNEMRRIAALAETDAVIMPEHLDRQIAASRRTRPASERELQPNEVVVRTDQPLPAALEHLERTMIQHAMAACHGRLEQAARMLGLSRKGLYLKRQRLGLDPDEE